MKKAAAPAAGTPRLLFDPNERPRDLRELLDTYAPPDRPSITESAARGVAQGASLGFADEIAGAVESAFTPKTYVESRDESREAFRAAETENPMAFGAGELGGGLASLFIPGGVVAKGAGLGARVAAGAATGAVAGLGHSEADLTKGELSEARDDVLSGAAAGAAIPLATHALGAGLGKVFGAAKAAAGNVPGKVGQTLADDAKAYAREQVIKAEAGGAGAEAAKKWQPLLVKEGATEAAEETAKKVTTGAALEKLKDGVQNSTKVKVFGPRGRFEPAIEKRLRADRELRAAVQEGPEAALGVIDRRLDKYGKQLDEIYERAQSHTEGASIDRALAGLGKLQAEYSKTTATQELGEAVKREAEKLLETFQGEKVTNRIPLQRLREQYRAWQDKGYSGGAMFSPSATKQLQIDVGNVYREALQHEVEQVAERVPELAGLRKSLQGTNAIVSSLKGIQKLLTEKSTRQAAAAPTMGQMLSPLQQIKEGLQAQGVQLGRAASANIQNAAKRGPGSAAALARLMSAIRAGAARAEVVAAAQAAIRAGADPATVDKALR